MKMHAEKKHKCAKCSNGYSTEWDLRRHAEDCGRTYSCTCGCPYASRAALLSHTYRTGHEIPKEHRYPPVKKRKMEQQGCATKVRSNEKVYEMAGSEKELSEGAIPTEGACQIPDSLSHNPGPPKNIQKLLLPKPKVALVNVPVMQLAHLPVLIPPADSSALRSVVLAVDAQGSLSTVHLLPQSMGAVVPSLNTKTVRPGLDAISTGVQVNLESLVSVREPVNELGQRSKSASADIQTDISYLNKPPVGGVITSPIGEASVSSWSQTDISVSAQVQLPVSVQTQTFPSRAKATTGAQTDTLSLLSFPPFNVSRETQTNCCVGVREDRAQMDQAIMCTDLFDADSLSVSTQTPLTNEPFQTNSVADSLSGSESGHYDTKTTGPICFGAQTDVLHQNTVADNQTQTMTLLNDLEHILSNSMGGTALEGDQTLSDSAESCSTGLVPVQEQHTGIDFDFEEFLNATHIQTQTEESALGGLNTETPLEQLDIETQTDFLLLDNLRGSHHSDVGTRIQSNDLELEMFDTQTQTDLNFLLDPSGHMPLGRILRESSFNMSTESSDTETQTDGQPAPLSLPCTNDGQVRLSSTETQTVTSSFDSLSHLFLTSNETQTVMDDFLSADLAWNVESHFSSVETQTCEELFSLLQHTERPNS
ncbi:ATM interactor [Chanos chanos]|uniref:ATM interactor n=1 Tax=Chanos chanos TaxID=29144 RepID=A0A6J2UUD5_CHACN|nr:ATM interactor [Chanos chanos]